MCEPFCRTLDWWRSEDGQPLTMHQAWKAYDQLLSDERVQFVAEPELIEPELRRLSSGANVSPKLWADAYLLAFATQMGGVLVTFDRALAHRAAHSVLLA